MRKLRESYLNGEKLFRKYFEMGSATSAMVLARFAVTEGMYLPGGPKPTPMGVWKAMWRWASLKENKEVAFDIFSSYVRDYGWRLADTDLPWDGPIEVLWNEFMIQKIKSAWQHATSQRLERFLRKNGWSI